MDENLRLELFTVAEVRNWLVHNQSERGLSEEVISRTRAWAIINSPYAQDSMFIISSIFVNDEVAAYTAVFPEQMARPDRLIYWDTTLYVAPKYEGRGYAAIVIGAICEKYGKDYFDHAAAAASVANFKFLGLPVKYVQYYLFSPRVSPGKSWRITLAKIKFLIPTCLLKHKRKRYLENLSGYSVRYISMVDDEIYQFIKRCAINDLFLRTQESFNWILHYPLTQYAPQMKHMKKRGQFDSCSIEYQQLTFVVYRAEEIVGFVYMVRNGMAWSVKYLYYTANAQEMVFDAVLEHALSSNAPRILTYDKELAIYIDRLGLYARRQNFKMSFTHPEEFVYDESKRFHAGEGDMFS